MSRAAVIVPPSGRAESDRRHRSSTFSFEPALDEAAGRLSCRLSRLPGRRFFRIPWSIPEAIRSEARHRLSAGLETELEGMVVARRRGHVFTESTRTGWTRSGQPADKFITNPNGFDGDEWEREGSREARRESSFITISAYTI